MWEILLGYALEKVFGSQTTAFEIGGEYVQTSVPGAAAPQAIGTAIVEPTIDVVTNPSMVCVRPESTLGRPMLQLGGNPFTPIILKGAEELLKLTGQDPYSKGEVY